MIFPTSQPGPGPDQPAPEQVPQSKAKPGHPTKYFPELGQQIAEFLRLGLNYSETADALGIGISTFRRWRKHQPALRAVIKKAEAEAVLECLTIIRAAGSKSWQSAAWWLERKYPDQWGRTENLGIEAKRKLTQDEASNISDQKHEQEIRLALGLPKDAPKSEVDEALEAARMIRVRRRVFGTLPEDMTPAADT